MAIQRGKVLKWLVILAILGGVAWAGVYYWKRPKDTAVEFKTSRVARGDITQSVTANGTITPVRLVEVGSQVSGIITEIKVDFNDMVKSNQIVAQIDPATYERALRSAEAELANAEAALEMAQLNYDRATELIANKLISKSDFDQQRVNLSQAKATVQTHKENVERAKVDLSRTTIYATMDGVVITRRVEAGQTVAASMNTPTLFTIANDLAKMRIETAVSEADIGGVEVGQTVQFTVDAFPGRPFLGRVEQVRFGATTNQNVVTYTTIVAVENKDLKLRPGMTATAKIITAERKGVLTIPNAAARFRPPTGTIVKGETNAAPAKAAAVALIENGPFAGLPVMPWQANGERRRPTEAERAAYAASLTPEQKQKYEKAMTEMRARFAQGGRQGGGGGGGGGGPGGPGGGGFGGFGGGGERPSADSNMPKSVTVYLVEKETLPMGAERTVLNPVTVKLGIADNNNIEVLEGLKEGDVVVSGTMASTTAATTQTRNPLGSPFGGPGRPR